MEKFKRDTNDDLMNHLGISTMKNDSGHSHSFRSDVSSMKAALNNPWVKRNKLPIPSENPTILDFAQLALDVYDYKENEQPEAYALLRFYNYYEFSEDWDWNGGECEPPKGTYSTDYDPMTGFYARLYVNKRTGSAVVAIRGISNKLNMTHDSKFAMSVSVEQYKQVLNFILKMKVKYKIKYITGHAWGGIIAKMIAPLTGLNVVAFNSSGVNNYLIRAEFQKVYNEWLTKAGSITNLGLGRPLENQFLSLAIAQKVLTYVVNHDDVGDFSILHDIGKHAFLSYGRAATIFNRQKNLKSDTDSFNFFLKSAEYLGLCVNTLIRYHALLPFNSMFHMYDYFATYCFDLRSLDVEFSGAKF